MKTLIAFLMNFPLLLQQAALSEYAPSFMHPYNQRGVYLHANSVADPELVENALGNDAIVFDVKEDYVYFQTESAEIVFPLYNLKDFVDQLHENGIYAIARYVVANDKLLGQLYPETRLSNPVTGAPLPTRWVNPGHEKVLSYNRAILREVVQSGVDEINLDYIRYPSDFVDTLSQVPLEEKIANVEAFVLMAREVIDEEGADTLLGISTYAILGWHFDANLQTLAQDVPRFAKYVDVISPMAYPQTFSTAGAYYDPAIHPGSREYWLVYHTLTGYRELLGDDAYKLRPWIQGYSLTPQQIRDEIQAVYDAGLCGYTVWSARNLYGPYYAAYRQTADRIPELCITKTDGI